MRLQSQRKSLTVGLFICVFANILGYEALLLHRITRKTDIVRRCSHTAFWMGVLKESGNCWFCHKVCFTYNASHFHSKYNRLTARFTKQSLDRLRRRSSAYNDSRMFTTFAIVQFQSMSLESVPLAPAMSASCSTSVLVYAVKM